MKDWRRYNGALVPLVPPHVDVDITDIDEKISETNSYFARWTSDFDSKREGEFWYVIQDNPMEIEDYSKNTRSKIRRGLKKCSVELVNKLRILEEGFECYNAAFLNYNTHLLSKTIFEFENEILELEGEWEFWGIFYENKMIGYSQNKIVGDYCDYSTIKFHPDYLKLYPSYSLFFTMNKYYLNEKKFKYVNDGARSISHETNIQEFLVQKFQFRKAYCKLHVHYSPKIKMILKLIYPVQFLISFLKFGVFKKINVLLFQEKIRKSYE
ncbi:MAG: hypothetical protein HOG85_05290 [Flavobacteriales bacterium]|jgi:hypothetical protein|nr:hypothetical protein [Flavobacteriales bacterium]